MMDIELNDVSCRLAAGTPYQHTAIDRLSLRIPAGSFVAVTGPNGSGKSTLAQLIAGLLPPCSGDLRVGPFRLAKKADRRRLWRSLGYLFQFPEYQLFEDTALQPAHRLSGGELKRVVLADVLASESGVLILDEPTAGLDSRERSRFLTQLKRKRERERITVLYVTHRLDEALEHAERILVLNAGRLYADLPPSSVRGRWQELETIGLVKTPLLRFIESLESRLRLRIPDDIHQEEQLVSYIARHHGKE